MKIYCWTESQTWGTPILYSEALPLSHWGQYPLLVLLWCCTLNMLNVHISRFLIIPQIDCKLIIYGNWHFIDICIVLYACIHQLWWIWLINHLLFLFCLIKGFHHWSMYCCNWEDFKCSEEVLRIWDVAQTGVSL